MEKFYLEDHLKKEGTPISEGMEFSALCSTIFQDLMKEWEQGGDSMERMADIQKRAIIGYEKEVGYFLNRIRELIPNIPLGTTAWRKESTMKTGG